MDRIEWLVNGMPICMMCGSGRLDIINDAVPAEWECLKCHKQFEHEPSTENAFDCMACHPSLCQCNL